MLRDVTGDSDSSGNYFDICTIKYLPAIPCNLNLTAFIEGFYNPGTNSTTGDTVVVYLRNAVTPYNMVDSVKSKLNSSGNGQFNFYALNGKNYYIILKHRNSIETWSSSGNSFAAGTMTYNFSTAANKAFGNNQSQIDNSPVRFGIFSGDVNQDEIVDVSDMGSIYNHAINFESGYLKTDVNGDSFIDVTDLLITYNNAFNFRSVVRP